MCKLYKNTGPFYITDLNIYNFQYPQNGLEPSAMDIVCFVNNENLTRTMARVLENKQKRLRSLRNRGTHAQGKQAVIANACFKSWCEEMRSQLIFFFETKKGKGLNPVGGAC